MYFVFAHTYNVLLMYVLRHGAAVPCLPGRGVKDDASGADEQRVVYLRQQCLVQPAIVADHANAVLPRVSVVDELRDDVDRQPVHARHAADAAVVVRWIEQEAF